MVADTKEMVPHQEFNSRLATGIRNSGEFHSETLAKESDTPRSPGWGNLP